jgi:phosphoenolpyruvate carboxylase
VSADSLRLALARGAETAIGHYLDCVHQIGAELSVSSALSPVDAEVLALAEAAHDDSPARADEPYRRALSGIYARLAGTFAELVGKAPPRPTALVAEPYASPADLRHDLRTVAASLGRDGGVLAHGGALGRTRSAFTWRRSTCGRTAPCMSGSLPSC